ncbi:MAG: S8 family serine peptidase [Ardenticatenaceae bacterium]|nr:S8 family serine peptidase [Ardenticatenaceae bacterium]MCB9444766.1 S8 family serine peptidase [Ardenticatenaceae bacterium]
MNKRNRSVNWGGNATKALFLAMNLIILLVLAVPGPKTEVAAAKVQPILLNLAAEEPDSMVEVIVQKTGDSESAYALAENLGAVVTKDLHILNAFAAQIPAQAVMELAQSPEVNWISFDGPVMKVSDSTNTFSYRSDFNDQELDDRWAEIGEADGPQAGDVALASFLGGALNGLRIQGAENGIQGQFDLSEGSSAVLSFGYRRKGFETAADTITIEVSQDGSNWAELDRLTGPATDPNVMFANYDVSAFLGGEFYLRFVSSAEFAAESKFYLDYVQVEYQMLVSERQAIELTHQVMLPIVMTSGDANAAQIPALDAATFTTNNEIIRDAFSVVSYSNNDGSVLWKDSWQEYDPYGGNGASGGYVYVQNGRLSFHWAYDENITRHADMSDYGSATLRFDWQTLGLDDGEAISVLVSKDGINFTELAAYTGSKSGSAQFDISQYLSVNTAVKFGNTGQYWEQFEYAYIDNVQIEFSSTSLAPEAETVRDNFSIIDWGNNNGSQPWRDTWHGYDAGGGSAAIGLIYIAGGRLTFQGINQYRDYAYRTADLSGSTQATLSFDWQTLGLGFNETISILVAKDINGPFVELDRLGGTQAGKAQYDISDYISANTTIRLENRSKNWGLLNLTFFDNVQIAHTCAECIDTANLDSTYVQAIRADQVWNQAPYLQGQGITVAVIDSGIANHIDLTDGSGNSRILTHVKFITDNKSPDDLYGHGTHVAGSIAGNGLQSNGIYMGVAPQANLVDVKVIDDHGAGYTSDVVAGIQWIYENHQAYNIRVVNVSLNSAVVESYDKSPLDAALEILWFNGITVVVSAGNNGNSADGYLYAPSNDPFFITVGATDDMETVGTSDDILASFSAHGNTQAGFQKPDVLAPGVDIVSLLASDDSNLTLEHPDHVVVGPDGNSYFRMSGTSMSSGVASGVVALLLQDEPGLNPDQVKYRLMATGSYFATPTPGPKSVAYLDVPAAINGTTTATANTGIPASKLLWSGSEPINWSSVNWGSVNWGSVNWGSVNWGSVNWGSVNWGSVNWGS